MSDLIDKRDVQLPAIVQRAGERTRETVLEFFAASIRNGNTRAAYLRAVGTFLAWADGVGIADLRDVRPLHVAAWIERVQNEKTVPTTKLWLAANRQFFDWLARRGAIETSPAAYIKGPRYSVRQGKTPFWDSDAVRQLFSSIDEGTAVAVRDRALIGLMLYTFARIGAALQMRREDVLHRGRRLWVRLHEKGGKVVDLPCNHRLEDLLAAYLDVVGPGDGEDPLFRASNRNRRDLADRAMSYQAAYTMVRRRCRLADLGDVFSPHSARASGVTAFFENGGQLERAQALCNHGSPATTQLYNRTSDKVALEDVERILF